MTSEVANQSSHNTAKISQALAAAAVLDKKLQIPSATADAGHQESDVVAIRGEKLSLLAFHQLSGKIADYPFVRLILERATGLLHFLNNRHYQFHADYTAEHILGVPRAQVRAHIDDFNRNNYLREGRAFCMGVLALHQREQGRFFTLELSEVDKMERDLLLQFFTAVKQNIDSTLPLYFKPTNQYQEQLLAGISPSDMPRMKESELFPTSDYVPLNKGSAKGRLRLFDAETFAKEASTLRWYDILVMDRVPDSIPRIAGIINSQPTTPLSHTNVLAAGWQIPNAVQCGILAQLKAAGLHDRWVELTVDPEASAVKVEPCEAPSTPLGKPKWSLQQIRLESPEVDSTKIKALSALRVRDRFRYGTKAANIGEMVHVLEHGSSRITGYYRIPRPLRPNLLCYLADALGVSADAPLNDHALDFLRSKISIPRGIALPFALQREFLEASPKIQQAIGKLKMALELDAKEVDPLCLQLMGLIRSTRMSDAMRDYIDAEIAEHLAGVSSFVVRSSSNAEDLKHFSAAGIYESFNHCTTADTIFESIKEVWASLVSPRSVRLRQDVGISLDDCYMGVIIQEEVAADFGGVMVTCNPLNTSNDYRGVFINVSEKSATEVVAGKSLPMQYLYNTVEGGGRTLSLGSARQDLAPEKQNLLEELAFCGRLLQSHFAEDYTFSTPVDIEWAAHGATIHILQLRPYSV